MFVLSCGGTLVELMEFVSFDFDQVYEPLNCRPARKRWFA
jgi:hypothetical protein